MFWTVITFLMAGAFLVLVFRVFDRYLTSRAMQELRQAYMHISSRPKDEIDLDHLEILLGKAEIHETERTQVMLWGTAVAIVSVVCSLLVSSIDDSFVAMVIWAFAYAGLIILLKIKVPDMDILDLWN